ncbi:MULTISPECIES: hypothetical protein [Bacillus]|uniref:hypothetical protein n=1 Tax=Bacillus TaxID=1386 RepID=UPI000D168BE0|nr:MULTISPECIES: hypothetical protein [Bacillus]MBR0640660.1 hypothetical protein [Bacillus safensis]PTA83440.1 hypothetical protein C9414_16395 [Bacillus sp. Nf3]
MCSNDIDIFQHFINEYYPALRHDEWLVDREVLRISSKLNPLIKDKLPKDIESFVCVLFIQKNSNKQNPIVIYLLLDHQECVPYAIEMLQEDVVYH